MKFRSGPDVLRASKLSRAVGRWNTNPAVLFMVRGQCSAELEQWNPGACSPRTWARQCSRGNL